MSKPALAGIETILCQPDAPENLLSFRHYGSEKKVRGKRREDHRRMAVCYWHTFVWNGFDVFGAGTLNYGWHPGCMGAAASNPDPDVFTYAAAQVQKPLEITERLGGANYVFWGGHEAYRTLFNTNVKRELAADDEHKVGFKGPLVIEPMPREPTKHQHGDDTAAVHA
jgi:xylose isomerase